MSFESYDQEGVFRWRQKDSFQAPRELARALLARPGRFRSPLSFGERLWLKMSTLTSFFDHYRLTQSFLFVDPGRGEEFLPQSFRVVLRYLFREGVIRQPKMVIEKIAHDQVRIFSTSLTHRAPGGRVVNGSAYSLNTDDAISKAVGEMLERSMLSLSMLRKNDHFSATSNALRKKGRKFLPLASMVSFSPDQRKNILPVSDEALSSQTVFWIRGKEILTGEKVFLPEYLAFLISSRVLREQGISRVREGNSNGSAGHFTRREAILSGIYELVERDSFLVFWLNAIAPPRIDIDANQVKNEDLKTLLGMLERYRFEAIFLNTTTDVGIPSCACVLIDRSGVGPRVSVGGGAGFRIEQMLLSSLYEALAVSNAYSKRTPWALPEGEYHPFSDTSIGRNERLKLWQNPSMFQKIEPWLGGPKQSIAEAFGNIPSFSRVAEEYEYTLDIFRRLGKGYEVYVYDREHPVLRKLGYHVVKVIIPELVPLYLYEIHAPLGAKRLKSVPEKLGYTATNTWNPWPHPFP